MKCSLQGNKIIIKTIFGNEDEKNLMIKIGAAYSKKFYYWTVDNSLFMREILGLEQPKQRAFQIDFSNNSVLMQHQKTALKIASEQNRYPFFHDTGTGKTLTGLCISKMHVKTLVICPLSVIENAWGDDSEKFGFDGFLNLWKMSSSKVLRKHIEESKICAINFEVIDKKLPLLLSIGFDCLLIDESSKIKNPKSKTTLAITELSYNIPHVYIFSGTPAPNKLAEYFSHFRVTNPLIFGYNYHRFMDEYFNGEGFGGFKKVMKQEKEKAYKDKVAENCHVVRKEDVLELPERFDIVRYVTLSDTEKTAYKSMIDDLMIDFGDRTVTALTGATKRMKLRQITSGFSLGSTAKEGNPGTEQIETFGNSKLTALLTELDGIGDEQVIIWSQFRHEAVIIADALPKDSYGICNGSVSQAEKQKYLNDFNSGKIQYIIGHPGSIGHGITLTNCCYAVYFSLDDSYERYYQSRDRIYRKGQKRKCTYIFLIVKKTIDQVLYNCMLSKGSVDQEMISHIKNFNGF